MTSRESTKTQNGAKWSTSYLSAKNIFHRTLIETETQEKIELPGIIETRNIMATPGTIGTQRIIGIPGVKEQDESLIIMLAP